MKPDSSETVYDGKLFDVSLERWGDHEREIVEHPGAVAILAVDRDGMVNLVGQRREAVRRKLVELPAGTLEEGEEPLESARRELEEETGLTGGSWREAKIVLSRTTDATGKVVENGITYGHLIGAVVDFVIIGFVIFLIIRFALPKPEAKPATKECPQCKTLIPAAATRCHACTQPVG